MADKKLTVVAVFHGKKGAADELKNELVKLISPSRKDEGYIEYRLHQCIDNPDNFMFYENWAGKKYLDAHLNTPHLKTLGPKVAKFLAEPTKVTFWEEIG